MSHCFAKHWYKCGLLDALDAGEGAAQIVRPDDDAQHSLPKREAHIPYGKQPPYYPEPAAKRMVLYLDFVAHIVEKLGAVDAVPDKANKIPSHIAHDCGKHDKYYRCDKVKGPDHVRHLYHVRPQDKVDKRLAPAQHDEHRPDHVPAAHESSEHERYFMRIMLHMRIKLLLYLYGTPKVGMLNNHARPHSGRASFYAVATVATTGSCCRDPSGTPSVRNTTPPPPAITPWLSALL